MKEGILVMKKVLCLVFSVILMFGLVSCAAPEVEPEVLPTPNITPEPTPTATPEPTVTPEPTATIATGDLNVLTGLPLDNEDAIGKRPVAIMVNNSSTSLPQLGIGAADIVVETLVEGGITRLMAMYGDYTKVPDVSAVRSCRFYYPEISESFDAIYTHWGADPVTAQPLLYQWGIDSVDGLIGEYGLFGRSQDRLNSGFKLEESSVFYGTQLVEALEENDHRVELEEDKEGTAFKFTTINSAPENGQDAVEASIHFESQSYYYSDFTYNEEDKLYYKMHNGNEHIDFETEEQLAFTNILVFETPIGYMSDYLRRDMDVKGEDKTGWYLSEGKAIPITWTKAEREDRITLYDEDGEELVINTGKTYMAYCEEGNLSFS